MAELKEAIALLEKLVEALYQKVDGYCPWCGAEDYPVCGDKQGYDEVKAEDAEGWQIEHEEDCIVTYLDQALALLKEQPPASGTCICMDCGKVIKVAEQSKHFKECPKEKPNHIAPEQPPALNSCPYPPCKGEGKLQQNAGMYYIYCKNCGRHTDSFETGAKAVKAWNKPKQPPEGETDDWRKSATEFYELGGCPICFSTDEAGCTEGCYLGQLQDKLKEQPPTELKEAIELLESITIVPAYADEVITKVLAKLKEQPPAGDSTKEIRQWVKDRHYLDNAHSLPDFILLANRLLDTCKIIDQLEARLKAMYAGDLSPESRLNGYKVVVANLQESITERREENQELQASQKELRAEVKLWKLRVDEAADVVESQETKIDQLKASRKELLNACEIALPFVVAHDIMQKVVSGAALQLQEIIKSNKEN